MSVTATPARRTDLLTRTTLQIDGGGSAPSLTLVIQALHRVPGVLMAEMHAASARAVVAHDSAVPAGALLAAASGAGAHARIVTTTLRKPDDTWELALRPLRHLVALATVVLRARPP